VWESAIEVDKDTTVTATRVKTNLSSTSVAADRDGFIILGIPERVCIDAAFNIDDCYMRAILSQSAQAIPATSCQRFSCGSATCVHEWSEYPSINNQFNCEFLC
jgi:hypothetical protein